MIWHTVCGPTVPTSRQPSFSQFQIIIQHLILITTSLWHSTTSWWSVSRNWFSSTTALSAWTLTSMLSEPTDPQKMPYLLPSTQSSHTWKKQNSYIRMLPVDFSSAFNPTSPMTLTGQLNTLGLSKTLCHWIFDLSNADIREFKLQSHLFYVSSTQKSHGTVCSGPSCSHCTPMTAPSDTLHHQLNYRVLNWSSALQIDVAGLKD